MLRDSLNEIVGQLAPEISKWPRREPGQLVVDGKMLKYADMHNFYWQAKQIFGEYLYHFSCDTDAPLILDCGAHIGIASLFFLDQFPKARVRAFEADSEIALMCDTNLRTCSRDSFDVEAKAVWINDDGVTFTNNKDDSGHIDSTLDGGIKVPSIRLKNAIENEKIQLLKLDVEGAEYSVLEDCHAVLHLVERMIIEVHTLRPEEGSLGSLLAQLESLGFSTCSTSSFTPRGWNLTINPPSPPVRPKSMW